ncbi:MAG: hypothetical protein KDK76_05250 [Chlamydiia bacterium]|nr:hypothetical protein [Chlamydiia bacterium]
MKKIVFLFLGVLMAAGGLFASCQKKEAKPERGPCHMDQPGKRSPPCHPCSPCKRY